MPFQKLTFRPGINRDTTNYANEGGWFECDKVRFYSGFPQKMGGWIEGTSERFTGTCRQLWNWVTSYTDNFLALGTDNHVYIEAGGYFYDITPIRTTLTTPATDNSVETGFVGTGAITGTTLTITAVTSGSLKVGNVISGSGITAGTIIETFGTAFGGTGTYTVSVPQTAGSTTITCAVSNAVTFNVVAHGCNTGDYVTISGVSGDIGGVPDAQINKEHEVTVVDVDNFTINVVTASTSAATGGGSSIDIVCNIQSGFPLITAGYGWGSGAWNGAYGWGLASPTPIFFPQRDWWFDNFDNDLVMNIRSDLTSTGIATGGAIYYWERGTSVNPTSSLQTKAVLLSGLTLNSVSPSDVPETAGQILISQNDKHLLAFGCQPYGGASGDYDPLLIRWATQDQPNVWTPLTTNSAGFIRVSRGSKIVRAIPTRQEILILTDTHVYSFQFLGTTDVFGLQELADNISVTGPRAATTANNIVYWMGIDKFYFYDGRVQTLPCTLKEYVFKDINFSQTDQIICGTNEGFNEVWWFYPSGTSNWIDRYVIYNHLENIWYYGNLVRTAWLDTASRSFPQAVYTDENQDPGILYTHEFGVNDADLPMQSFIQSSDFDIGDGEQFMLSRRLIPDVNFTTSNVPNPEVTLSVRSRNFPGSNFQNDPSDSKQVIETAVGQYTDQIYIRARGRQMALKISSEDLGVQWQLGVQRLDVRPDGKR